MTSDTDSASTATDGSADPASRGRPRDTERTAAILDATHTVLHAKGWGDLTMSDIAKEAGCGLATIYRRWENKEQLVAAAMRDRPLPVITETGDARTDLVNLLLAMAEEVSGMGESIIGFIAATQSDPVLREAFAESMLAEGRPRFAQLFTELLGADSPHIELLIDGVTGSLLMRTGVLAILASPQAWVDEVMALVDDLGARS